MVTLRIRAKGPYRFMALLGRDGRDKVLAWKRRFTRELIRHKTVGLDQSLFDALVEVISTYFGEFDCMTVPAPSFHTYSDYPIWHLAKKVSRETGLPLRKLFPAPSGKTRKVYIASLDKKVQHISLPSGQLVLVFDDVATTRWTMVVSYEAILRKGSYPCGLVLTVG